MRIVGRLALEAFSDSHPQLRSRIRSWLTEVTDAKWQSPQAVKAKYPRASIIRAERIVFDLGKRFRVDTAVGFEQQVIQIIRFAFHKEYERWTF